MTQPNTTKPDNGPLPNFLLIGAQKAGSSTLHDYLSTHDQIYMSHRKELHYFDDAYFTKNLADYRQEFRAAAGKTRIGESTPAYLSYPGCAEKIKTLLGDIPLIVILRDPVARMYSQYWHGMKYGHESLSFRDAIACESERHKTLGMPFHRYFDYLSRSAYQTHIRKYRRLFPRVHVCNLEDLATDPLHTLNAIYDFLELPHVSAVAKQPASNPSKMARSQSINRVLNRFETRFGATRLTGLLRRKNFYPFKYPQISDQDRQFAIERLHDVCPDTVASYGLR